MAFDGICVAAVVKELNETLTGGRITKISQPENEEICIFVKPDGEAKKLFINASASMPSFYFIEDNKPSPMTAPNFCMVLRKHLQGGRILSVTQPGLERVVYINVEHLDEMGDLCKRVLVFELMGKHSNLILMNEDKIIIDSLKHVSSFVSSVREVLPGREYFIPKTEEKADLMLLGEKYVSGNTSPKTSASGTDETGITDGFEGLNFDEAFEKAAAKPLPAFKKIYTSYTGISPQAATALCTYAGIDADRDFTSDAEKEKCKEALKMLRKQIAGGGFHPAILYENGAIRDFTVLSFEAEGVEKKEFESVSEMLSAYYADKNLADVMRAKSADLRKHLKTVLERDIKKLDLQKKQQRDAEDREKYRIYGELLNAYSYQLEDGKKFAEVLNYYDNTTVKIPLDENKTISENAVRYFDKYNKCKRTAIALEEQIRENEEEIAYLEGILTFVTIAEKEEELNEIRRELAEKGFVKRRSVKGKSGKQGKIPKSKPLHYKTTDGYDIYVGKNNYQNEAVTFEIATGNDWWFHAKGVPGAHVVVKCSFANQATEWDMPDEIFELAGALAAANSKNKDMEKVEVDYLRKKNIKRPNNADPGFVVYYTNYSLVAKTDLSAYKGLFLLT